MRPGAWCGLGQGPGHIGGAGRRPTEHGHHKVLAGLGLGVLGHARVGTSLGGLHATQLEAAPAGDHAVRHAALWGGAETCQTLTGSNPPPPPGATTGPRHNSLMTPLGRFPSRTLTRPLEPLHHPLASWAHKETEAQTGAGSLANSIMTFLSWVSRCSVPWSPSLVPPTGDISCQDVALTLVSRNRSSSCGHWGPPHPHPPTTSQGFQSG